MMSLQQFLSGNGLDIAKITEWVEQQGGITAIIAKLRQGSLADAVASWIGSGENQPVSGESLQQGLGSDAISQLAAKLGVDPAQASAVLAGVLPQLVDHLSPGGQEPEAKGLLSAGLDALKSRFF